MPLPHWFHPVGQKETPVRCVPGQTDKPVDCADHKEHRWCPVCAGWFDLYHVLHPDPAVARGSYSIPGTIPGGRAA